MPKPLTDDQMRDRLMSSLDDAARWKFVSTISDRALLQKVVSLIASFCDEDLNTHIDELRKRHASKGR